MSESQNPTIIELRQANNPAQVSENSLHMDYEVILNQPITLQPGSVVELNSCFLDTATKDDGMIDVVNDDGSGGLVTISADFGYYLNNLPTTNEGIFRGNNPADLPPEIVSKVYDPVPAGGRDTIIDGERFVACYKTNDADPVNNTNKVEFIKVRMDPNYIKTLTSKEDGVTIFLGFHFNYTDLNDKAQTVNWAFSNTYNSKQPDSAAHPLFNIMLNNIDANNDFLLNNDIMAKINNYCTQNKTKYNPILSSANFPITIKGAAFTIDGSHKGVVSATINTDTNENGDVYTMIKGNVSFQIPSGKYSASELTEKIGLEFTSANNGGAVNPDNHIVFANDLLKTSKQMLVEAQSFSDGDQVHFVRAIDGTLKFTLTSEKDDAATPNYYVGTNQFGLVMDSGNTNKAVIELMHFPLMDVSKDTTSALPQSRLYKNTATPPVTFSVGSYSGIFLTSVKPASVWGENGLKFSGTLTVSPKEATVQFGGQNATVPVFNNTGKIQNALVPGLNVTQEDSGIDTAVLKFRAGSTGNTAANTQTPELIPALPSCPQYLATVTSDHVSIIGNGVLGNAGSGPGVNEGYYQLEIDMGIKQNWRGQPGQNANIQGIINRYYSGNSYCAYDGGNGIFPYVHSGQPKVLSRFKIRLLDPNGGLATDVSTNNCVFLKITPPQQV